MFPFFNDLPTNDLLSSQYQFAEWTVLNDTIMGGQSSAFCHATSDGLLLEGKLIEQGGGFVSCRSPLFSPPINLSEYSGLKLELEGQGRTLKFAITCKKPSFGIDNFLGSKVRWVSSVPTNKSGLTIIKIPFSSLEPAIRAKPVNWPIKFNPSSITQFQLLHSKFGQPGKLNPGFKSGLIKIRLRSINAYF